MCCTIKNSIPGSGNTFFTSPECSDQLWAHIASYLMGTGVLFWVLNRPGCDVDHSPQLVLKLQISGPYLYSLKLRGITGEKRLRWSRGSMLAFGTQVRRFEPGRSRRIFKGEKIFSTPSFRGEVKPSVPCCRFAACKRSLELRGSGILDEICRNISRPRRVPPSAARGLSRCWM